MTTKTRATPGPWKVLHEATSTKVFGAQDQFIGRFTESDAKLIAAAPTTLEALKALLDQADEAYPHFESPRGTANRGQARDAISAAEGS